jgi:signal transduction histidine kinase
LISNSIQSYVKIEKEKSVVSIKDNVSDTRTSNDFINYGNSSSASLIGKVSSGVANEKAIDLIIYEKGDNIIISVSDHGCGMPDEVQKKLFKEMITTKGHNGSGLGMFMSYSTIKGNFKGDITFTSKVGKGTTFNVILPRK